MKKILTLILIFISLVSLADEGIKRVTILEVVDKENRIDLGQEIVLRAALSRSITNTSGYEGYERVDLEKVFGELNFQRTGAVSDEQIKKIGEMTGAKYVLIAEAAMLGETKMVIVAKILDVETAKLIATDYAVTEVSEIQTSSDKLAASLLEGKSSVKSKPTANESASVGKNTSTTEVMHQNYTETAFGVNMKMIWVEGGDFMMGCTSEQGDCYDDEKNVRRVTVDGFYIGMLEVTQAQWEKVMGTSIYQQKSKANANSTYGVGPDYPMYYVSWEEATEFCRLLSNKTGRTYTLPTEAQWEYAARGGKKADGTKYAGSNVIDAVAWYGENSGTTTHVCGSKRANALGIYDMSGNVWEWCKDWYASSYVSYDTNNPTGPSSESDRVLRGGSWYDFASYCLVANRNGSTPSIRDGNLGFRVVLLP